MSARSTAGTPLKVLIVEDHHDARTTLRMLLAMGFGHVVIEAVDGESGVRSALDHRPHVALIDLGLPDVDGKEVARRIRASLSKDEILLVALTGYGSAEDQRLAYEAGFDLHLVKPVESAALQRMLDDVAQVKRS